MKTTRLFYIIILYFYLFLSFLFCQVADSSISYFLEDHQYFKPLIAHLRTSQNHARIYYDDAVKFSNSTEDNPHLFFDVGFGGYFPILGWKIDSVLVPMKSKGIAIFIDGSAHMLLDMYTQSSDVINTDYRIGGGLASRFLSFMSFKAMYFHESTHIGDEYTLDASKDSQFKRYNISYEALEVYLALDKYYSNEDSSFHFFDLFTKPNISYFRVYGGGRILNEDTFEGVNGVFEETTPILTGKNEYQFGAEVYFRAWNLPKRQSYKEWYKKLYEFQHVVIAVDFKSHHQYSVINPAKVLSRNIVLGFVYGENFAISNYPTTRLQLNYYEGLNPHGQFRNEKSSYLGLDYIIMY